MTHAEMCEVVRRLCHGFAGDYGRAIDRARRYPADVVVELAQGGGSVIRSTLAGQVLGLVRPH